MKSDLVNYTTTVVIRGTTLSEVNSLPPKESGRANEDPRRHLLSNDPAVGFGRGKPELGAFEE
jgi:hypothetical protein